MTRPKKNLIHGYRRGNTTSGAKRRGNRSGSRPAYPPGTELFSLVVKLSDPEYAIATILGDGIATKGVRRALSLAAEALPPGTPQTRAEAYVYAKEHHRSRSPAQNIVRQLATPGSSINFEIEVTQSELEEWER